MVDSGLEAAVVGCVFQLPSVSTLIVEETRVVVAFVEVFEDGGENLGELFGEIDSLGGGFEELPTANGSEEWRFRESVFVSSEKTLLRADAESDDGRGQVPGESEVSVNDRGHDDGNLSHLRSRGGALWFLSPRLFHLLRSGGMLCEGPLGPACRDRFACSML